MKRETLLTAFLHDKAKTFPAEKPVRKGRPKGELIGWGREKHLAALLSAVYTLTHTEIAKLSGAKKASVDVWATQQTFQDVMETIRNEFLELVKPEILKCVDQASKYKLTPKELASKEPTCPKLTDAYLYSAKVRIALGEWALNFKDYRMSQAISQALLLFFGSKSSVIEYMNITLSRAIAQYTDILQGQKITRTDKEQIIAVLQFMQQYLDLTKTTREAK